MKAIATACFALPLALLLAGCGDETTAEVEEGEASGEVLPGSISDDMIALDQLRSEAENDPRAGSGGDSDGDGASAADDEPSAPAPAASEPEPTAEPQQPSPTPLPKQSQPKQAAPTPASPPKTTTSAPEE